MSCSPRISAHRGPGQAGAAPVSQPAPLGGLVAASSLLLALGRWRRGWLGSASGRLGSLAFGHAKFSLELLGRRHRDHVQDKRVRLDRERYPPGQLEVEPDTLI